MRPHVAARSPMSGASWRVSGGWCAECVRVPGRADRRGRHRSIRCARLERETGHASSYRRAHRHSPLRCARRVAARSPMRGASLPRRRLPTCRHLHGLRRPAVGHRRVRARPSRVVRRGPCGSERGRALTQCFERRHRDIVTLKYLNNGPSRRPAAKWNSGTQPVHLMVRWKITEALLDTPLTVISRGYSPPAKLGTLKFALSRTDASKCSNTPTPKTTTP